jgi:hypothetical protein
MNKKVAIFLSAIFLLTSCGQSRNQAVPILTSTPVDKTATPISLPTLALTVTPLPISSPTIISPIERRCSNFMGEVSMITVARGTIFPYNSETEITTLLDIQSGQEYRLPLERKTQTFSGDVSLDQKYYAYTEPNQSFSRTIIWVINAKAEVLVKQAVNDYLFNLRWLDDEHLLFDTKDTEEQAKVVVFNLKTSEFATIAHELPSLFTQRDIGLSWRVSYSPDLQKVLYIGRPHDNAGIRSIYLDLVSQKTLWESPPIESVGIPLWSPDGQQFALEVNWDLYIIKADGQVVAILDKNQFGYFNAWSYTWSSNGQFIGFRSSKKSGQDPTATLMVYDVKSKRATDYCLEGYSYSPPGWSPDSTQLVVDAPTALGGVLLIDLPTNQSYKLVEIANVLYPGAWIYSVDENGR